MVARTVMTAGPISLKKNFSWVFAGNAVNAACQWAVVALLAKLGGAEMLGTYVLAMAIIMPVNSLAKLQLRAVYVTDAAEELPFRAYLTTGAAAAVLGLAAIIIWGMSAGYLGNLLLILGLLGLSRSLDNPSELLMGFCQKHEQMHWVGLDMMLRGVTTIAAVWLALTLTGSLTVAAAALVLAAILRMTAFELPIVRRTAAHLGQPSPLGLGAPFSTGRQIAAMGIPLGLVLFLGTLANSLIRLVLESHHGKEMLAYYGAAAYPLMVGTMVVGALGQSAAPRLSRFFLDRDPRYWRLLGRMVTLAALLGLLVLAGVWLVGKQALGILYAPAYADYQTEFVIMAAGSIFLFIASVMGFGLTAARRFGHQFWAAFVTCSAAAALAWGLIPEGGIRAAAWVYFWVAVLRVALRVVLLVLARRPGPTLAPRGDS